MITDLLSRKPPRPESRGLLRAWMPLALDGAGPGREQLLCVCGEGSGAGATSPAAQISVGRRRRNAAVASLLAGRGAHIWRAAGGVGGEPVIAGH